MSNLHALSVAVDQATRVRDNARLALQDALAAQQVSRAQLEQLEGYARETETRWGVRENATMQPQVMYHHYQFMDRLGHAAGMQTGVVDGHAGKVEASRLLLLQAELRLASLCKVVDKRNKDVALQQMRRDQKQTDERASLKYRPSGQEH